MAKKNNNNGVENKNKNNDGGEMKEDGPIASKFVKWVKSFQGAVSVKSEGQANKLTVVGKVDPTKLRDELATKTKNKVDLVSPQPKKNKVNRDDANDTKKEQPEKTDNDEKPKEAPLNLRVLNWRILSVLNWRTLRLLTPTNFLTLSECTSLSKTEGCCSVRADMTDLLSQITNELEWFKAVENILKDTEIVPPKKKNGGNDSNDGNDGNDSNGGNGGGGGDEKKKKEDEGNGGGKMKYPAGQSGFGQFSYGKGCRHGYGYQNGALKFLVVYNHLAKDIFTNVTLHTHHLLYI